MKLINVVAWVGTACILCTPYLLPSKLGFIMGASGCALILPPCVQNRQWNLIILNVVTCVGYCLQIFNII